MRGNFVSIPTDCPQRDERLSWTGDIQVFSPTASFLYNTSGMLSGWLKDLAVEQIEDFNGVVPLVVPCIKPVELALPRAAWSDAAIIVPWDLYQAFGDRKILLDQYESMKQWLEKGWIVNPTACGSLSFNMVTGLTRMLRQKPPPWGKQILSSSPMHIWHILRIHLEGRRIFEFARRRQTVDC